MHGLPRNISAIHVARVFVYTLIPIAIAYHLAHFLTFFLIYGQQIIPLLSDPFGYGWDLFGTASYEVDIAFVGFCDSYRDRPCGCCFFIPFNGHEGF